MKLIGSRRPDPLIDLTPMIDIVFQLVLFFMVTTTFKTSSAIQVDLPRSAPDVVVAEREDLFVVIGRDGQVFLGDSPVGSAALSAAFAAAAAARADTLVIIKADRGTDHGTVVSVMDLARSYGLSRLAIATEPRDREEP